MAENRDYIIDGYIFSTPEDANLALNEKLRVEQIEKKLNYNDSKMVNAVLIKAINKRVFKTPVGYDFLRKLQKAALKNPPEDEEVPDIPVYGVFNLRDGSIPITKKVTPSTKKPEKPKQEFYNKKTSILINVLLLLLVCVLFVISMTGSSPTILNYEKAIQDRYAQWEKELTDRESVIREKEKELLINE
jgi:hypothetical protein